MRALRRRAWPLLLVAAVATGCTAGPLSAVNPGRSSAPSPAPAATQPREVVVGVDDLSGGFNPHTLADLGPVGTAVADLVYPSAFVPAGDGWRLNTRLLVSALVTDRNPFTVVYRIRDDAAWSNATPIAAEDFAYLAEQMSTQPGVVNPAGYELIDHVVTGDGGKMVKVVFSEPYPAWRSLFRHLLPAHLLKDAPGGWDHALDDGIPVSGGPFQLAAVDPAHNGIVLVRTDRYWATPARLDRLVLRELPPKALVDALRTGGVDVALFTSPRSAEVARRAGRGLPEPAVLPRPLLVRLVLRPAGGQLAVRDVRAAVAAALDRDSLLAVAGIDESSGMVANAQVLAPSQPGYEPTLPPDSPLTGTGSAPAGRLLSGTGYRRVAAGWIRGGDLLTLEVAAPGGRGPYARLAQRVAIQLRAVGIRVRLRIMPGDELVAALAEDGSARGADSASGGIDVAVLPQPVGADPGTVLASVHCPVDLFSEPGSQSLGLAGFCKPSLRPLVEAALTGASSVLETVEPVLWQRLISIPLYQPTSVLITRPELRGFDPGGLLEGPLHDAAGWRLAPPQ